MLLLVLMDGVLCPVPGSLSCVDGATPVVSPQGLSSEQRHQRRREIAQLLAPLPPHVRALGSTMSAWLRECGTGK